MDKPTSPWGVIEIPLPATEYDLDEDGTVWMKKRPSARDFSATVADDESSILAMLILGWALKAEGQEIPYSREAVVELPFDIQNALAEALGDSPFVSRLTRRQSAMRSEAEPVKPGSSRAASSRRRSTER